MLIGLDLKVGLVALCMIGFIFIFSLATTILPSLSENCPYRSPQAFAVFICVQGICWVGRAIARSAERFLWPSSADTTFGRKSDPEYGRASAPGSSVATGRSSFSRGPLSGGWLRSCAQSARTWLQRRGNKKSHWSWQEREEATLLSCRSTHEADLLDEYDSAKMDPVALQDVVRPCLLSLPLDASIGCFLRILIRRADAVDRRGLPDWDYDLDRDTCQVSADILLDMLEREELSLSRQTCESEKRFQEHRVAHEQVLEVLQRLIFTRNHCTFLHERYERIFNVLLSYIRKPQYEYVKKESNVQKSVFSILAYLGDKIPPNAVDREDIMTVVDYTRLARLYFGTASDASLLIARLAISMVLALPPTVSLCAEDIVDAVRDLVDIVIGDLKRMLADGTSPQGCASADFLPALHSFLSLFAALLGANAGFLTAGSWPKLRGLSRQLSSAYQKAHHTTYVDAEGRSTAQYLKLIDALYEGEAPPSPFGRPHSRILRPVRETLQ
ncbi:hypothetical protein DICSQDRAFT_143674 [Dichomitus squalens LYAD-421 SS1]|uniref:uncharacterized protein n=1 Tax=Dichomitus squalens (strain LYAD-421) TaxID=732165 RepID=UPI0004415ADE|nr:uncharacterized protein DICSQDRAFT_143674 [Dichomitus squalens LYAD-421 SS1]EJF66325.1 hypothetical protein DICSQDRAFT_143674 [Dichomitus squalens LYAD-421 SS1]